MDEETILRTVRALLDLGYSIDAVLSNPLIPPGSREHIRLIIEREKTFTLTPARTVVRDQNRTDWVSGLDRSTWYYWPALRNYLLTSKGWDNAQLRSLDDTSDRILRQLDPPWQAKFDNRGLVLGYVQSGKTASFTSVIAKAADAGYRLIIVLSGIDNSLRRQTNIRLKRELVGYSDNRGNAVHLPPMGKQWHEFTREDFHGDFMPGYTNDAALQGTQPVLLVIKKNGHVLRRLLAWLRQSSAEVRHTLPALIIDDEADLASVDTSGTYQTAEDSPDTNDPDYEPPSAINGLIRELLEVFDRRAYVAYTATPFANILIPHDTSDPRVGNDLYPRDFIVDLPKPTGYFGAEEIFGRLDTATGDDIGGIDVIRDVPDEDIAALQRSQFPASLEDALLGFVLAGAARISRGQGDQPATMLVHTSQLIVMQSQLRQLVSARFAELRDEWRYHRNQGIRDRLKKSWEDDFRKVTRARHPGKDVPFSTIERHIGEFFEVVQIREINSRTGEVLDYEREPSLKAIAIGGNRLARGLTLEGLLVSFFIRPSATYDTLMQMGRWFGFRDGYEDLTRIWTTGELAGWFSELAHVEHRLREDIEVYESQGLTPLQVGGRIWQHPAMQVTAPLKRRFARDTVIAQSYSLQIEQTYKFPLRRLGDLALQAEKNRVLVREWIPTLGKNSTDHADDAGPVWTGVSSQFVLEFLKSYVLDADIRNLSMPLISAYIERSLEADELTRWTVAVRGRGAFDNKLGRADWNLPTGPINQISRSRLGIDSVGVITGSGDELVGLTEEERRKARDIFETQRAAGRRKSINSTAREMRSPRDGLLLLYPISRFSAPPPGEEGNRHSLFNNPNDPLARDLVGLAISFPRSNQQQQVEAYLEGTVGWRPFE